MALRGRYDLANTAEICRCYVEQEHRRRGIGRQLMTLAEAYCQRQQYKTLYLHTHHFYPAAISFGATITLTCSLMKVASNKLSIWKNTLKNVMWRRLFNKRVFLAIHFILFNATSLIDQHQIILI